MQQVKVSDRRLTCDPLSEFTDEFGVVEGSGSVSLQYSQTLSPINKGTM